MNRIGEYGGLVVVGSYVKKSSDQLAVLLESELVRGVELNVGDLLAADEPHDIVASIVDELTAILKSGNHAALYSSRDLVTGHDSESNLHIGQSVSQCLVDITRGLRILPRFIIAKGGITSSDLATGALSIKRARVLGQILPGIPVWQPDSSSRYSGGAYVVFPRQCRRRIGALARAADTSHLKHDMEACPQLSWHGSLNSSADVI